MVIKGNGGCKYMEDCKINNKRKEEQRLRITKVFFFGTDRNYLWSGHSCTCYSGFSGWIYSDPRCEKPDTGAVCMDL